MDWNMLWPRHVWGSRVRREVTPGVAGTPLDLNEGDFGETRHLVQRTGPQSQVWDGSSCDYVIGHTLGTVVGMDSGILKWDRAYRLLGEPGARTGRDGGRNPDCQEGLASWGQKGCSYSRCAHWYFCHTHAYSIGTLGRIV